ncbi:MAG: YceI family protein [Bacteroidales bacterium]|nr:YceI family protein [Bacteroidales bacterium]
MRPYITILLLFLTLSGMAGSGSFYSYAVNERSRILLTGTTNVNSYECVSDSEIPRGNMMTDILPGSNAIYFNDAILGLEVSSFDCGNRLMNKDLHQALGGSKSPFIKINLLEARPVSSIQRPNSGKIRVEIAISINGTTKNTDLVVDYRSNDSFTYTISGTKALKMSDFGIDPPSPAMGLVRVRDQVVIHFDLLIETNLITQN